MRDGQSPVVVLQVDGAWWRFANPVRVVVAKTAGDVDAAIREVERGVEHEGLCAAGYLAYEAAAAYGLATHSPAEDGPPLAWFGLFQGYEPVAAPSAESTFNFGEWQPSLSYDSYETVIGRIKNAIAAGDTYQINYTFPLRALFEGDAWALFANLAAAQRADFCAYVDLGRYAICSASPELFFRLDGSSLTSRPMKGTASRGLTADEDRRQIDWLRRSEKNRAENVMIVDMIRNDFGRIAHTGSVAVPALFTVERYPTLLQMTSTVTAETDASLSEILAATFPCASITGAPKVSTMSIIQRLEPEPRGVYTGSVGFVAPGRRAQFNVAIRTAVIDRLRGRAVYGVGSGVVWDSDARAEYEECLLKSRVLHARPQSVGDFRLLESLRWSPDEGYFLLDRHLRRLGDSADYFNFKLDKEAAERALSATATSLTGASKVRLLVDRRGQLEIEAHPIERSASPVPLRIGLARQPVASTIVWLYHKTTRRDVYDQPRNTRPDCDDVILWNERGELTESTIANLVLELEGRRYTPPVSCGLLPGTMRAHLLESGEIAERVLTPADLDRASGVWLINSVRGWISVVAESLQNPETS